MNVGQYGGSAFAYLDVELEPGEEITAEADAMSSMSAHLELKTRLNGGFFGALARRFLGNESLFINQLSNPGDKPGRLTLVQAYPGDMREVALHDDAFYLQPGAFIACESGVKLKLKWAGIRSFIAREGLFRLQVSGQGRVWYGAYGALIERELDGETIVDTSHLVAYEPGVELRIQLAGGIFSSLFGGEGLVTRLQGKGRYTIQTRSIESLASWINPKLW